MVEEDWVSSIQSPYSYDIHLLKELAMQKKVIYGVGNFLFKSLCGKNNNNIHSLVAHIQQNCNSHRLGIEVDQDKREIQLFYVPYKMHQEYGMLKYVLDSKRRRIYNEGI